MVVHTTFVFSTSVPKWVSDVEKDFPKDTYIARLGTGDTADNARANALGQIAGFFKSEVVVSTSATENMQNDSTRVEKKQTLEQTVQVVSDMTLTAVEYNAPYYDKKKKTYFVVAYIHRAQGLQALEPKILQLHSKYKSFIELSKKADEAIMRKKYLIKAKESGEELVSALYMALLFDPTRKQEYRDFSSELSQNHEIEALDLLQIPLFVQSRGDFEDAITAKVCDAFKASGFLPASTRQSNRDAVLKIEIDSNEKSAEGICMIYPSVSVTISSGDGSTVLYSFQRSWGKTAGFSLAGAQKKAFPKIAEELQESLIADFRENFMLK